MGRHVAALGFLYALAGLLTSALGALVVLVGSGPWGRVLRQLLELLGLDHLSRWLGLGFGATLLAVGVVSFVTAFGLFMRRRWGRLMGLVGAATQIATLAWPAILLGGYGLWVLLSEGGRGEFRRRA